MPTVLLIGSTGNGKSTLGNYLHNPDDQHMYDYPTFAMAKDNKPQTHVVQVETQPVTIKGRGTVDLTIIDTPGLNESAKHDLIHMMQVVAKLKDVEEVHACIFVVKFNAKIDSQYKATVEYYSKLLPSLFDNNVIVVMTDFAMDDRSEWLRGRQGIDVDQVKHNTVRALCESANIPYQPILFTIDCMSTPYEYDEVEHNHKVREAILAYIHQLRPTKVKDLKVAKTAHIKELDEKAIQKYEGEINGYNDRLQEADKGSKQALEETLKKERDVDEFSKHLEKLKSELAEKDTPDLVVANSWSISEGWKLFRWMSRSFEVTSKWELQSISTWTNSHCEFKNYIKEERKVSGKVEGKFMRGLYASVELQTTKQMKYAEEIERLKSEIAITQDKLRNAEQFCTEVQKRYNEHIDKIKLLQGYIEQKRQKINALSPEFMTLEQAHERLLEL